MSCQATPRGTRGRTQTYSDPAIQFCPTIKNLFGLALRQSIGFIQSLFKMAGLDWSIPDYNTLSRRQQTLQVQTPYQKSAGALHLLVMLPPALLKSVGCCRQQLPWSTDLFNNYAEKLVFCRNSAPDQSCYADKKVHKALSGKEGFFH